MGDGQPRDRAYEDGWLDAYGRRDRKPRRGKSYNTGFDAGARDRKDVDRRLPQLRDVHRGKTVVQWPS